MKEESSDFIKQADEEFLDRYVSLSKAASILGYASYISVRGLIKKGIITPYLIPGNSKNKILLSDLHKLLEGSRNKPFPRKRGRGRPTIL